MFQLSLIKMLPGNYNKTHIPVHNCSIFVKLHDRVSLIQFNISCRLRLFCWALVKVTFTAMVNFVKPGKQQSQKHIKICKHKNDLEIVEIWIHNMRLLVGGQWAQFANVWHSMSTKQEDCVINVTPILCWLGHGRLIFSMADRPTQPKKGR